MYSTDSCLSVSSRVAFLDGAALVVILLAARDRYFKLYSTLLEVTLCNNERHPLRFDFDPKLSNLLGVKQQLARAFFVVPECCMGHLGDLKALYPSFASRIDIDPRVPEIGGMLAQAARFASD